MGVEKSRDAEEGSPAVARLREGEKGDPDDAEGDRGFTPRVGNGDSAVVEGKMGVGAGWVGEGWLGGVSGGLEAPAGCRKEG